MNDLTEIANNLSSEQIISLVTKLGADRYEEKNNCIIFPTICHNANSEDASMKLYYYPNTHRFMCYTDCGCSFNIYELFKKRFNVLGKEYNFYTDIVKPITGNTFKKIEGFNTTYKSDFGKFNRAAPQVNLTEISPNVLNKFVFYPTIEWLNDGISVEAMKHYNILYSLDENKIIIPHYNEDNKLIGVRARALNSEDLEMGKYMPVIVEGQMLSHPLGYNLYGLNLVKDNIKRKRKAIIAEGEKAALQLETMIGPQENICVSACGSSLSSYQIDLLIRAGAETIILAFDKEGKDWKGKERYYKKLKHYCDYYKAKVKMGFIWDSQDLLDLKDSPFDGGLDTFLELYKGVIFP